MGRLQGVAIRKPGDLPAVCTGQSDAQCREESAVRVSWGILPRFSAPEVCLCLLYASDSARRIRERFFHELILYSFYKAVFMGFDRSP